jgi:Fic family protein
MSGKLQELVGRYRQLGVDRQLDYGKFYLYSIITHSTAIEGSTITELENQIMFDNGLSIKGKSLIEQNMNLDLKAAYDRCLELARVHADVTVDRLKELSALTMRNTGTVYHTMLGDFSSADGDLRLVNVSAGVGGRSYMSYNKVPQRLQAFCDELNAQRRAAGLMSADELYNMSFDAHYHLVTIHPWADGNGRMSRLLMNWLQFEYGLVPSRILSDDKEAYIKALVATRDGDDLGIFRAYMRDAVERQLTLEIEMYQKNFADELPMGSDMGTETTSDKILALLRENPRHTTRMLAAAVGISGKGVEKQLAKLKAAGLIARVGAAKGGYWQVNQRRDQGREPQC